MREAKNHSEWHNACAGRPTEKWIVKRQAVYKGE
jgi:hypothetical protein